MQAPEHLDTLFSAERQLRSAEERLLEADRDELMALFAAATRDALALEERGERILRLERLADLCAQVAGPSTITALLHILNSDEPSVRVAAGEALLDVAYERFGEVARAIEGVLDDRWEGPGLEELPFLLAEVGEPGCLKLLRRFLQHDQAEVVAAAIEASVELGDPELRDALGKLANDPRQVQLDDEEERVTLGDLSQQALDEL